MQPGTPLGPHDMGAPLSAAGRGEWCCADERRPGREVAVKAPPGPCSARPLAGAGLAPASPPKQGAESLGVGLILKAV